MFKLLNFIELCDVKGYCLKPKANYVLTQSNYGSHQIKAYFVKNTIIFLSLFNVSQLHPEKNACVDIRKQ